MESSNLKKYYLAQIQKRETEINEKIQNIKRLEAQRFELNANGTSISYHSRPAQIITPRPPRSLLLRRRSCQSHGQKQSPRQGNTVTNSSSATKASTSSISISPSKSKPSLPTPESPSDPILTCFTKSSPPKSILSCL